MPKSLEAIRLRIRQDNPRTAGEDGERLARTFMDKHGWKYEDVDQDIFGLLPALRRAGGKRPDFILATDLDKEIVLLDAKQHSTNNGKSFTLTDAELEKYRALEAYTKIEFPGPIVDIVFFLFPKEHIGKTIVFVGLSDFDSGTACELHGEPAISVDISGWLYDVDTCQPRGA